MQVMNKSLVYHKTWAMKTILFIFCLTFLFSVITNCHKTTVKLKSVSNPDYLKEGNLEKKVRYKSILLGIKEFSIAEPEKCPDNKAESVVIKRDFVDSVIHIFLGVAYTTRSVELYCH